MSLIRTAVVAGLAAALVAAPAAFAAPAAAPAAKTSPAKAQATPRRPLTFTSTAIAFGGLLVIPAGSADQAAARAASLPSEHRAAIARAATAADFEYGARKTLTLRGIGGFDQILLLGLGETPSAADVQMAGAVAGRALAGEAAIVTVLAGDMDAASLSELATGFGLGEYRSDLYATDRKAVAPAPVTLITDPGVADAAATLYKTRGLPLVEAMEWARDLSNEPANAVYPESFVDRARAAFAGVPGVSLEVLDVPAMQRLGMGALTGVGAGSARPPRLLVVRYKGAGAPAGGPVVLAGKGITFDSGGISIKPGANMGNMKMDMSGAAAVVATVLSLSKSAAPVDVVAVAALAENMPDGAAIRPGDVLTAMNGKTIEVINTDAEGRLVLADALAWTERNLKPAVVVDIATLTGAVVGALGDDYAGLFSRHDDLAARLAAAGAATGEDLWRLPLHPSYAKDTSSTIADIKNSGDGPGAGTGAWFIGEFISRDIPWAHLDIAGVAYGGPNDWKPAGSAGYGVRLLDRFVRDWGR